MRIEQRNNNDGAQIVDDSQRHQKNLQRSGNPITQQRQYAKCEGNIGRRRNRPTLSGNRILAVKREVDQRRNHHSAQRRDDRKHSLSTAGQRPLIHFTLHFKADKQEKYRHQRVVNPQQHVLVDLKRANL